MRVKTREKEQKGKRTSKPWLLLLLLWPLNLLNLNPRTHFAGGTTIYIRCEPRKCHKFGPEHFVRRLGFPLAHKKI